MRGLRDLRVSLSAYGRQFRSHDMDDGSVEALLRPLIAIEVPAFVVEFHWPVRLDEMLQRLGTVPFSISVKE